MAAIGGSFEEVTYNHPTLGTGFFRPKMGEDSTYDPGGIRSDDEDNGLDGSGNMIIQMSRTRWSIEIPVSNDMNDAQDLEQAIALTSSPQDANWTFTHINGTVYAGKGRPVGDMKGSAQNATFTLKIAGGGILKKI